MLGEWTDVRLGDVVADVTVGYVSSMIHEYRTSGVPFLRSQDVKPHRIDPVDLKFISHEFHQRISKSALKPGDVVVVRTGAPGTAAVIPESLPEANCADLVVIRSGPRVEPRFLAYYFNSKAGRQHVHANTVGAVQQHFNVGAVREARLRLPSIQEQRTIAQILGALDDKVELNRRMNETLEAMARVLFKSWFVEFDPVRAKAEGRAPAGMDAVTAALFPDKFEESELAEIPRGWQQRPLYDCATWVNGAAYRDFAFCTPDQGLPIIKIAELKAGITSQTRFTLTNPGDKYLIDTGDVLFSWSGNPDTSIDTFVWVRGNGWLNQHIFKVITRSRPERTFVLWLLRHLRPVFAEIARNKQTTGLGHVTAGDMRRLQIIVPAPGLLAAFNAVVGPLTDLMHTRELENLTLARLRDLLLPKLLSGELRVRDAEKVVGKVA